MCGQRWRFLTICGKKVKEQYIKEPQACKELLIESIKEQMDVGKSANEFENRTSAVLVIGVNGVGKTTTIGKIAGKMREQHKKVVLAAADTFRAAAGEQLKINGKSGRCRFDRRSGRF